MVYDGVEGMPFGFREAEALQRHELIRGARFGEGRVDTMDGGRVVALRRETLNNRWKNMDARFQKRRTDKKCHDKMPRLNKNR